MNYRVITSPPAESISAYKNLKRARHDESFIAESEKVVLELLRSNLEITSLYLTQEHFDKHLPLIEAHVQETDALIYIAAKSDMETIVGYSLHQGILASAKIPAERSLDDILRLSAKPKLFLILDEIADAENMGALYRTALALGVTAIILDDKNTSPWLRRALRVGIGAAFSLPTVTAASLVDAIKQLRAHGIHVYAATLGEEAKPIWEYDLTQEIAIIFGSEGHGIRSELRSAADSEVIIPISQTVDSLNVAVAQGMMLYEVQRQRA